MKRLFFLLVFGLIQGLIFAGCGTRNPVETFMNRQKQKIVQKSVWEQAELSFIAALYEPTREDVNDLRLAWNEHSRAFPESKPITEIESALRTSGEKVVLVAVYTSDTDRADIANKSLGWSISPVPLSVKELSETDAVLRTFFPMANQWSRYFLLRYNALTWNETQSLVLGRPSTKVELVRVAR